MPEHHKPVDEIESLVRTINDNADRLHLDSTPSVQRLIDLGLPAAKAILDLLDAPELQTRMRAQRVLEGVVMRHHGWKEGQGYPDDKGQEKTKALLQANLNYQADAPPAERKKAIEEWRRWLEAQSK